MTPHDFTGAPCLNNPPLWESTYHADHNQAAKGCNICPHIEACLDRLAWAREVSHSGDEGGPEGTWAGQLINPRKKRGRPRKDAA